MALNKEIWLQVVTDNLFADDSFMERIQDDSMYAVQTFNGNYKVHIPNAGAASTIVKDRSTFTTAGVLRTDQDVSYTVHSYSTDPIIVPAMDEFFLSYDKVSSVIRNDVKAVGQAIATNQLYAMSASATLLYTTGTNVAADTTLVGATGNAKSLLPADFSGAVGVLASQNVPSTGRVALVPALVYYSQMANLDVFMKYSWTGQPGKIETGIVGRIYGVDVYVRSASVVYDMTASPVALVAIDDDGTVTTPAGTDRTAILIWQENCVSKTLTGVNVMETPRASIYGPEITTYAFAGGSKRRYDSKGIVALICA